MFSTNYRLFLVQTADLFTFIVLNQRFKSLCGKSLITKANMKKPSFLMVLTGLDSIVYKRDDGILIVPVGCLKN